jgi:molybdate transport system ATP-binding protein
VIGPSGAGKSTLLRLVAGLLRPRRGVVECNGARWFGHGVDVPPERRGVGFVFQDYALFPHMTVHANVAFQARRDVDELLEQLGIERLAAARPAQLSGGERQRVALARALATEPVVLLLDEPLSALDPATRGAVAGELRRILHDAGVPAVIVTHAYEEAAMLGEQVAVLDRGRIVQRGTATDLLEAPATPFVAEFAGVNYLPGSAAGDVVQLDRGGAVILPEPARGAVAVLVAPWEVTLSLAAPDDGSARNRVRGPVERVVVLGNRARVVVAGVTAEVTPESVERLGIRPGLEVVASWKATATRVLAR